MVDLVTISKRYFRTCFRRVGRPIAKSTSASGISVASSVFSGINTQFLIPIAPNSSSVSVSESGSVRFLFIPLMIVFSLITVGRSVVPIIRPVKNSTCIANPICFDCSLRPTPLRRVGLAGFKESEGVIKFDRFKRQGC